MAEQPQEIDTRAVIEQLMGRIVQLELEIAILKASLHELTPNPQDAEPTPSSEDGLGYI